MNKKISRHLVQIHATYYQVGEKVEFDDLAGFPFVSDDMGEYPNVDMALNDKGECLCNFWSFSLHELITGPPHIETLTEFECSNIGQDGVLDGKDLEQIHDLVVKLKGDTNCPFFDVLTVWEYKFWTSYWENEADSSFEMLGVLDHDSIEPRKEKEQETK